MGLGGISVWQLLIILAIIVLIFGPKRLKNLGSDLGNSIKGFRKAIKEEDKEKKEEEENKF
jgi:sec-independent protein translocase protein TatA|tara:strand:+ start:374 stop:556 length:183 start_codon:yes stop_codon:yes gene_type:complete